MKRLATVVLVLIVTCAVAGCAGRMAEPGMAPQGVRNLTVTFIDVGQGDAAYIETPGGATMLIDAGSADEAYKVTTTLHGNTIDYVVASHPHEDHIGGMATVLNTYAVRNWLMDSGYPHTSLTYKKMLERIEEKHVRFITPEIGEAMLLDPYVYIVVMNPQKGFGRMEGINDNSVVLDLVYRNVSFLFAGDAERNAESLYARTLPRVSVLKVAHHGSATSTGPYLLSKARPEVSVISVGAGNQYGHPADETIARLEKAGSRVYRTDRDGDITVTTDGNTYTVICEKVN